MVAIAVLSPDKHKNLRVRHNPDLQHMKDQNVVSVSVKEMSRVSNNFPTVLVKHPESGEWRLVALLGFKPGENLYYDPTLWKSTYAPLMMLRNPFLIGPDGSEDNRRLVPCVDEDSPWLSETEGTALFKEDGSETDYLKNQQQLLGEIFDGEMRTRKFLERLEELGLVTEFEVALQTRSGAVNRYTGMQTINEEKLKSLDTEVVKELHDKGYLAVMYMMLSSLGQFNLMVRLRNLVNADDPIVTMQVNTPKKEEAA